jgi:hypothetical protein
MSKAIDKVRAMSTALTGEMKVFADAILELSAQVNASHSSLSADVQALTKQLAQNAEQVGELLAELREARKTE